jgi:hypothetical protein
LIKEAQMEAEILVLGTAPADSFPGDWLRVQPTMLLAASCFVWAGMVLGISFLETPVKFTAPSVTLPIGLDVGRHVFGMFNKVEIGWSLLVCGLLFISRLKRAVWLPLTIAVAVVALQTTWLLPVLDARVGMILNGQTPLPASYHLIYVMLEVIKLICLVATGMACLRALTSSKNTALQGTEK